MVIAQTTLNRQNSDYNHKPILLNIVTKTKNAFRNIKPLNSEQIITSKLFRFAQLPIHLQDNQYLLTGYRAFYSSYECIQSLFFMHNETVNIWSHVFGALLFLFIFSQSNNYALPLYYLSTVFCLLCSAVFHTFHCHLKRNVYDSMAITDYTGISALFSSSFLALIIIVFRNNPYSKPFPLMCAALASLLVFALPWFRFFRSYEHRTLRTAIFAVIGVPIVSMLVASCWEMEYVNYSALRWACLSALTYSVGAVIYATQVPERLFPGIFDTIGSSHQIWHILVFFGALFYGQFLSRMIEL